MRACHGACVREITLDRDYFFRRKRSPWERKTDKGRENIFCVKDFVFSQHSLGNKTTHHVYPSISLSRVLQVLHHTPRVRVLL